VESRRYVQRIRATAAEETRSKILEATRECLGKGPLRAVSVDEIARTAGVARSTVYVVFGSREGLFDALAEDLLVRIRFDLLVQAAHHPDAREALVRSLRQAAVMYAAERDVCRALISVAALDPDAARAVRVLDGGREAGMVSLARRLHQQDALRDDVSAKEAADILWVITSFDTFDQLYTGRGIPARTVAKRLVTMAERAICSPPQPSQ
jgi:AcrR family transcriptional regulator